MRLSPSPEIFVSRAKPGDLGLAAGQQPQPQPLAGTACHHGTVDTAPSQYRPLTIAEAAAHVAQAPDESTRRRILLEFLEGWTWAEPLRRASLADDEPRPTGDERWDVLLAGIAEHVCEQDDLPSPMWTRTRTLRRFWFPDDTPAARNWALVHAPAALRRRGVFIAAEDLVRV